MSCGCIPSFIQVLEKFSPVCCTGAIGTAPYPTWPLQPTDLQVMLPRQALQNNPHATESVHPLQCRCLHSNTVVHHSSELEVHPEFSRQLEVHPGFLRQLQKASFSICLLPGFITQWHLDIRPTRSGVRVRVRVRLGLGLYSSGAPC